MEKLQQLAIRISEISCEIKALTKSRDVDLMACLGSEDEDFSGTQINDEYVPFDSCLSNSFQWVRDDRSEQANNGFPYNYTSFSDVLNEYGCANCKKAYQKKKAIGELKQERGRLLGNISIIGKALRSDLPKPLKRVA